MSFGQVVEKLQEHYGITISASAIQNITKKHAKACYDMLEKEADLPTGKESRCLIGELDGAMIPIVLFEPNESADKRKWRKTSALSRLKLGIGLARKLPRMNYRKWASINPIQTHLR